MNATSVSRDDPIAENVGDSDSDTNSDDISDYYQPIPSIDDGEDPDANNPTNNGFLHQTENQHRSLTSGHYYAAENGVRSMNLREDDEERETQEEEEEDDLRRVEMDSAMWRAFEEDNSRRIAPLSSENAARVMEAMREISFAGSAPDWVHHVPEDNWVQWLQRLRQPPHSST